VTRYTYGDSDLAAERLGLVAATFAPATRRFLLRAAPRAPVLAVDLGCGPGHTTALVHEVTHADRTVGLDASAAYVARARAAAPPGVSFEVHDAAEVPFPTGPVGLVYARLLLAHLREPEAVVRAWTTQLTPGGVVLLDDLEAIVTTDPALGAYLEEVAGPVVRREGGALLVGPVLHAMPDPPETERIHDDVATFTPPATVSARIFAMNLAVLVERGETEARPGLADALAAIADGRAHAEPVAWSMRQVALRRVGSAPT
jgi:SAM-dependent methyltransferase